MRRLALATALLLPLGSALARAEEVVVDGRTFRVLDGFTVEKVGGPGLVDRPIVADFDEAGRLYVADSSGSNDNVQKQLVDRTHRVVRLEDSDGDGKFDKSTVFADRMMFPEGAMWLGGSLYVSAPPSIWKLTDADGDGVAETRVEWFQGKTLTGCANDLHGPYAGPDGRVYWCKGAFAPQTYERPGRKPLQTRAAHIFRAKLDGSEVEPVMTGGMDNPVEVAFGPEGERFFTTTFLQNPGGGKRDGVIHALYGGMYGKVNSVLDGHPRTGPELLPAMVHLGPAAPSGLMRAESDALGSRGVLFATCFNLRKVTRHRLTPEGGSFRATTEDFLATDDLDFHPTDVLEDADGSLLVVDTGGWYKICCPTSQIVKPDVLGAIYRVRRKDAAKVVDPRGARIAWADQTPEALVKLLDEPRHEVRKRAVAELARRGDGAVSAVTEAIRSHPDVETRRNAVWAASRIETPTARRASRDGLNDASSSVRHASAHVAGLWRDREAASHLVELLGGADGQVARASAEALGRIGDPSAIPALLKAAGDARDGSTQHSCIYAVIEIDDPAATRPGLSHSTPGATRAALIALDQMEGGALAPEPLLQGLASGDPALREAAWWVAGHHPEWGEAVAGFFRSKFRPGASTPADLGEIEARLASMSQSAPIRDLIGSSLASEETPDDVRVALLRAMARSGLKETPGSWVDALTKSLGNPATVAPAVGTAKAVPIGAAIASKLAPALLRVARDEAQPSEVRLGALAAIPGGLNEVDPGSFDFLLGQLGPDRPASSRVGAADVLARGQLGADQYVRLAEALATGRAPRSRPAPGSLRQGRGGGDRLEADRGACSPRPPGRASAPRP